MDKTRKKRIKRYIAWGCLAALVLLLAFMPLMAAENVEDDGPAATIKSGTVETGSITTVLGGGGTLAEDDAENITIPTGVKLTEFLVENGDTVSEGDALAAVDKVSVMTAIAEVQETLDYLDDGIEAADSESGSTQIKAQTAGKVKIVYAQPGDDVQDVILEHGALAVLSLDGRMAVDIETDAGLKVGDSVLVALEDGEEVTGHVESTLGNILIITISDDGYAVDAPVKVSTMDGDDLGSGKLYIYNAWNATAYYGTVSTVWAKENSTVYAGQTLFALDNADHSSQYEILVKQRQDYEEVMQKLFRMYQSGVVTAPCDGIVSGVDEDSAYLLAAGEEGWTIQWLSNDPLATGEDYTDTVVWIQSVNEDGTWNVKTASVEGDFDYKNPGVSYDTDSMTDGGSMESVTIYTEVADPEGEDGATIWQPSSDGQTGDILLVAGDSFAIRLGYQQIEATEPEPSQPTLPSGGGTTEPTVPSGDSTTNPSLPSGIPSGSQMGGLDISGITSGSQMGGLDISGMLGGFSGSFPGGYSGGLITTPSFELFDLTENTILTVTPKESMTLDITIDELDIGKITVGSSVAITVNALTDETFDGTVTKIGTATNSGGNSKFTVTISLPRDDDMLSGMSACASMTLGTAEDVLMIPAAALNDNGSEVFVYTSYDAKKETLGDPVTVTIGASDGENVQILAGLNQGDTYYYSYYDAQETK